MQGLLIGLILFCVNQGIGQSTLREVQRIGNGSNVHLLHVAGITGIPTGGFLVSDKLDYRVKRFDARGFIDKEVGERGKGPGQFAGPGPIAWTDDGIAVADFSGSRIQLFSQDLEYVREWQAPGAVLDMKRDSRGALWVALFTGDPALCLIQCDATGKVLRSVPLRHTSGDPFNDLFCFAITPAGKIVVVYYTQNMVEEWTITGEFLREYTIGGVPLRPGQLTTSTGWFSKELRFPEDLLVRSIASDDNGNIFILSAAYAEHPYRDIIVIGSDGKRLTDILLPYPVGQMHIGSDGILTVSGEQGTVLGRFALSRGVNP